MSSKREALLGRFRARSLDRVRQVAALLVEREEGRGDEPQLKQIARELHTLKGDARVVGLDSMSELAHALEDLLLGAGAAGELGRESCSRGRGTLELIARVLREELPRDAAEAALDAERAALGGAPAATATAAAASQVAAPDTLEAPARPQRGPGADERWMRVRLSRVDEICERVSELSADFRALASRLASLARSGATPVQLRPLAENADRCRSKVEDAVAAAWSLRLVPIEPALEEMVVHARELAAGQGKRVRVVIRGEGAEVERGVLDELQEPLLHLLRNAVDHGLETPEQRGEKGPEGNLTLYASMSGPNLVVRVTDDGRGVDVGAVREAAVGRGLYDRDSAAKLSEPELLELLFVHGFSTRGAVSQVSGRGIGLDIVRDRVEALGGTTGVTTQLGRGTSFELTVPATITRERVLVVESGGVLYGLPAANVLEVVRVSDQRPVPVAGGRAMPFRGEMLPLRSLSLLLGAPEGEPGPWAVVLELGTRRVAIEIAILHGEQELLRRALDVLLAPFAHLAASATLDDGRLVLLLSPVGLLRRQELGTARPAAASAAATSRRVLVVDDSLTVVDLLREVLADAGFSVQVAHDGQAALAAIEAFRPELVLADVDMPVMDGFELLRNLRARWPHLPVVMLTTRGSGEDRRQAASLGASAYLVKSQFEEVTLVQTVRRCLGAPA